MRHYQEHAIEFRRDESKGASYSYSRGVIVYIYGSTIEKAIEQARKDLGLGDEWKVINCDRGVT